MASSYWSKLFLPNGNYTCPWCSGNGDDRELVTKKSNSANNPGRFFVSCSKDHGGCGLFCFIDEEPKEKFNPFSKKGGGMQKRAKIEGTQIMGDVVNQPSVHEVRLAELATKIDGLATAIARLEERLLKERD